MAISKVKSASIATDAVGPTQLNEASNYAFTGTVTGAGGVNTPSFFATTSTQHTITNQTDTKIQFATEVVDTDNCYDPSTNYRFTPTTAGKYHIFLTCSVETQGGVSTFNYAFIKLKKNGSLIYQSYVDSSNNNTYAAQGVVNAVVDMNGSSDYVEGFINCNASSSTIRTQTGEYMMFGGYKIIE